jgi:ABC-type transport system substrate-binding protein
MEPVTLLLGGRVYDPISNNSGFKNDTYEQLLNQAAAEPDKGRRKSLYSQVNDVLLDEAFAMPIAAGQTRMVTRAAIHDVGFNMWNGSFSYTNAWIGV